MNNHHFTYPPKTEEPETVPFDHWKARQEIYAECKRVGYERGYREGQGRGFWIGACLVSALITIGLLIVGYLAR